MITTRACDFMNALRAHQRPRQKNSRRSLAFDLLHAGVIPRTQAGSRLIAHTGHFNFVKPFAYPLLGNRLVSTDISHRDISSDGMPVHAGSRTTHDDPVAVDRLLVIAGRRWICESEEHHSTQHPKLLLSQDRFTADETSNLVEVAAETQPRLQRRVVICDIVTKMSIPFFDAQRIERVIATEAQPEALARIHSPVEYVRCKLGRHIELPTKLAHVGDPGRPHKCVAYFDLARGRKGKLLVAQIIAGQ